MWSLVEETYGEWLYLNGVPFARVTEWPADRDLVAMADDRGLKLGELMRLTGAILAMGVSSTDEHPSGCLFYTTMF